MSTKADQEEDYPEFKEDDHILKALKLKKSAKKSKPKQCNWCGEKMDIDDIYCCSCGQIYTGDDEIDEDLDDKD